VLRQLLLAIDRATQDTADVAYEKLRQQVIGWRVDRDDGASKLLDRLARGVELCPADTISPDSSNQVVRDARKTAKGAECRGGESNPYTLAGCGF
jgi:hypothetical protein